MRELGVASPIVIDEKGIDITASHADELVLVL
jgi:hypothetical protein